MEKNIKSRTTYQNLSARHTHVADYAMKTLFEEGYVKMPAQCIIEIMKLIKGLREIDKPYTMRVVKDIVTANRTMAYEFYTRDIEGMKK